MRASSPGVFWVMKVAMAALLAATVLVIFVVAFKTYGKWLGDKVYEIHDSLPTPAHTLRDDRDFLPTPPSILFGHHFSSIAGAAPIIGPCVAAYWGWLPALLWIVVGVVTMGAVHDFGALVLSVREQGRSVPDIAGRVIHPRVRILFLCLVMVLSWLVLAVFAMAIASMFVAVPASVLPVNVEIVVAMVIGWLVYRKKIPVFWPSIAALIILYALVVLGSYWPVDLSPAGWGLFGSKAAATQGWIVAMLLYAGVASLLPVWLLVQPRDYINSHQLIVALGLLFIGLFVAAPPMDAPAIRILDEDSPPIFPLLFVTVACGAISGFHGLVASGTTSKQLGRLQDAHLVGYGAMLGEGALALASLMAAVAGIGLVSACDLPGQGAVSDLSWAVYYDTWAHAGANKSVAFVYGGAAFLEGLGIPTGMARTLMAVVVISFAATTLDTATRIERMIIVELGDALKIETLQNRGVATAMAIVPALLLATWQVADPVSGQVKAAGWLLWPIFGASNQMIAALILMVLAIYFARRHKKVLCLLVPMVFVMVVTTLSLLASLRRFWMEQNLLLFILTLLLSTLMVWMALEGWSGYRRSLREDRAKKG